MTVSASAERDRKRGEAERKQLELAMQVSQARLSQVLDSATAVIISFRIFASGDWEYDYFSPGCQSILGYSSADFMADKMLWRSRMHPDDLATLESLFATLFAEPSTVWEYRFYHRDGSLRWLSSTYASQKIAEGCWQVTVVGQDISDRKQAELTLQRQIRQAHLLNDITEDICQSLDLEAVLARTVERSRALLEYRPHPPAPGADEPLRQRPRRHARRGHAHHRRPSGGFVQVESEVGRGTQMQVYLPALSTSQGRSPQTAAPEALALGQGELILLVDDDSSVQQAVRSLLRTYSYRPLIASSGPEALDLCAQHQPTLVVLDIMMPGMDGLTLIQHLKARQPDLTLIATSGLEIYQPAALAAGAEVFLPEPYDFRDLLKTIADLLR
ncbi:response regulator [Nodosilinea sp. AN01ver1]|uniref:response regulator n=1 Tax=Nodosilinea sp. AN01ver1 TaxID=3423362 RepID=UPI003D317975